MIHSSLGLMQRPHGIVLVALLIFLLGTLVDTVMAIFFRVSLGGLGSFIACSMLVAGAYRYRGQRIEIKSLVDMLSLKRPVVSSTKDKVLVAFTTIVLASIFVFLLDIPNLTLQSDEFSVNLLAYAVSAALVPPFFEEMIDRGFIQSALEKLRFGVVSTILISSSIFSISHIPANVDSLLITFIFGIFAGLITWRTKSVWIPFWLHAAWNFGAAFLMGLS